MRCIVVLHILNVHTLCTLQICVQNCLLGETASSAGKLALKKMFDKVGGAGGLIIIDK